MIKRRNQWGSQQFIQQPAKPLSERLSGYFAGIKIDTRDRQCINSNELSKATNDLMTLAREIETKRQMGPVSCIFLSLSSVFGFLYYAYCSRYINTRIESALQKVDDAQGRIAGYEEHLNGRYQKSLTNERIMTRLQLRDDLNSPEAIKQHCANINIAFQNAKTILKQYQMARKNEHHYD